MRNAILGFGLALCFALPAIAPTSVSAAASLECSDASNLCLEPADGAAWEADKSSTAKDKSGRSKGGGKLSLTIDNGRGSLFINGRYAGTAPLDSVSIPSGKNDLQVRDGAEVITSGLLTVPKGSSLTVTVNHP